MASQVSIKQLPQITEINKGDLILVQTPNATNTLLFENFIIGLDNTTFSSTISSLNTSVDTLSTNLDSLSSVLYQSPVTETGSATHGLPITIDGTTYNILIHQT